MKKRERKLPLTTQVRLRVENMDMHLCPDATQFYGQLGMVVMGSYPFDMIYQNCHSHLLLYDSEGIALYIIEQNPDIDEVVSKVRANTNVVQSLFCQSLYGDCEVDPASDSSDLSEMIHWSQSWYLLRGGILVVMVKVVPKMNDFLPCMKLVTLISNYHYWLAQIQLHKDLLCTLQRHTVSDLADVILSFSMDKRMDVYQASALAIASATTGRRLETSMRFVWSAFKHALSPSFLTLLYDKEFEPRLTILCNLMEHKLERSVGITEEC